MAGSQNSMRALWFLFLKVLPVVVHGKLFSLSNSIPFSAFTIRFMLVHACSSDNSIFDGS